MTSKKQHIPPEMQALIDQVNALGNVVPILKLLSKIGIGSKDSKNGIENFNDLKKQAEQLALMPSNFNEVFQHLGWIASESSSIETMKAAIELAQKGHIEQAEKMLAVHYTGENLKFIASSFWGVKAFRRRMDLIEEAVKLCQEERYLAAIPLLLIVVDGVGQDCFGKAIFSQGVDLTELNAIAGHETGLGSLTADMGRTRQAFNDNELHFPYRNGIMHGRDINFGNILVAAKIWAYLQCVADVIRAKENEQLKKPKQELSLLDSIKQLQTTRAERAKLDAWTKRPVFKETWMLSQGTADSLKDGTPEETLAKFLLAWEKSNYGEMGRLTVYFDNRAVKKRAGEIRKYTAHLKLVDAKILSISDEAPAITNISTTLNFKADDKIESKNFIFCLVYGDEESSPILRGFSGGSWKVIASYQGIQLNQD